MSSNSPTDSGNADGSPSSTPPAKTYLGYRLSSDSPIVYAVPKTELSSIGSSPDVTPSQSSRSPQIDKSEEGKTSSHCVESENNVTVTADARIDFDAVVPLYEPLYQTMPAGDYMAAFNDRQFWPEEKTSVSEKDPSIELDPSAPPFVKGSTPMNFT